SQSAFGGQRDAIVCRLAVDQESRPGTLLVRYPRALAVALLAHQKKKSDFDSFQAQPFRSTNLRGNNALGVTRTATVTVNCVLGRRNERRHRIHVRGEN